MDKYESLDITYKPFKLLDGRFLAVEFLGDGKTYKIYSFEYLNDLAFKRHPFRVSEKKLLLMRLKYV